MRRALEVAVAEEDGLGYDLEGVRAIKQVEDDIMGGKSWSHKRSVQWRKLRRKHKARKLKKK
jgi:hypothetical protein